MRIFIVGLIGLVIAGGASAADIASGKTKAAVCAGCHNENGISTNPLYPNLVGQPPGYLVKQMKAFKSGERADPNMGPLMQILTEQDMENVAAYFASLGSSGRK